MGLGGRERWGRMGRCLRCLYGQGRQGLLDNIFRWPDRRLCHRPHRLSLEVAGRAGKRRSDKGVLVDM